MKKRSNFKPLLRAVGVVSAVIVIMSGVTYSALQSQQAVLSGNTITSASADLKVSADNVTFTSSRAGFNFTDIIPGGAAVPAAGYAFYLKNSGSTATTLKVSVGTTPGNVSSVDLGKVNVVLTKVPGGTSQTFTLAALIAAYATGGSALTDTLASNATAQYKIQVSMAADAFTGSSASLTNIDLVFTGVAF